MKELDNNEIKNIIFEILCVFSEFCDEHDLRYYLCGGTLLGAVRHKGFIPWDDDIDVMMPRPDYERLHVLMRKEAIKPYYKLISIEAGNSFWPFAKILDTRTHIECQYTTADKCLWIDIFPMDGLPNNKKKSDKLLSRAPLLKIWFGRCTAKIGTGKGWFRKIIKIPIIILLRLYTPDRIARKMDNLARQYDFNKSEYVGGVAWSLGPQERMKKIDYLPYCDVEFCGRKFHAPACWDYYLTKLYGDYMKLPPENQRINHEFIAYIAE